MAAKEPGQVAYEAWMRTVYKEGTVDPAWHEVDATERKGWAAAWRALAEKAWDAGWEAQRAWARGALPSPPMNPYRLPPKGDDDGR